MANIDKLNESAINDMVKTSLFEFVNKHIQNADLSVVDEIVLNYVIAILEEASEDPNFDVDGNNDNFKLLICLSHDFNLIYCLFFISYNARIR